MRFALTSLGMNRLGYIVASLCLLMSACSPQKQYRSLVPLKNQQTQLEENITDGSTPRLTLRLESVSENSTRWMFSASLTNANVGSRKTLNSDFGSEIEVSIGGLNERLSINSELTLFESTPVEITASSVQTLLNSTARLTTTSGTTLSREVMLHSRALINPMNPGRPEDFDFDNCFSSSNAPQVLWLPESQAATLRLSFQRQDNIGGAAYTDLVDSTGRWNSGIQSRDLFRRLFSAQERQGDPTEEVLADVRRTLSRISRLGTISLQSSPRVDAEVVLEVTDDRLIFVSYFGECD